MDYFFNQIEYNYKDILHDTFKNTIAPEFKKRGFKKKGKTFYRECDELIEICNVQFSRFNHSTTASFTYNIQIAIPSLYDLLKIEYKDKLQTPIFYSRFGGIALWANGFDYTCDYWYKLEDYSLNIIYGEGIEDEENFDELAKIRSILNSLDNRYNRKTGEGFAEVVVQDIENIIIKFFNSIPSAELLIHHINNDEPHGEIDETMMLTFAELYYFNGEQEKGRKIFSKIRNGCFNVIINRYIEEGEIEL